MSEQLQQAITFIKAGDTRQGGTLLKQIVKAEPENETAWLWLTRAVKTKEQRIYCLQQALAINPHNQAAQKMLSRLQAQPSAAAPANTRPPTVATPLAAPASASEVAANIWFNEDDILSRLVILEPEAILVANPAKEQMPGLRTALQAEPSLPSALRQKAKTIPLSTIHFISADQARHDLTVQHWQDKKLKNSIVRFADSQARNEFLQQLEVQLGTTFTAKTELLTAPKAALAPGCLILVVGVLTALFYSAAAAIQAGETASVSGSALTKFLKLIATFLANSIGSIGVAIIGGLLIMWALVWLVRRVQNPPTMLYLQKKKSSLSTS